MSVGAIAFLVFTAPHIRKVPIEIAQHDQVEEPVAMVVLRYLDWDFADVWCGEHREGYRAYCHPENFKAVSPLVYHNNGDGTFSEVAARLGLAKPAKGLGVAFEDYDKGCRLDLVFANDWML